MASWFDLLALFLTGAVFVGAIFGIKVVADQIKATVNATKESLKAKGLTISDKGVSVRTSSRYSREDYVDATQRGFIKAMGASSFATGDPSAASSSGLSPDKNKTANANASAGNGGNGSGNGNGKSRPVLSRVDSTASSGSGGAEKKRHRFGLKRRESEI